MSNRKSTFLALLTAVSLVAPMAAVAQQGQRPSGPPTAQIAKALGVSEKAVKTCFPAQPQGEAAGKAPAKGQKPEQPARPDASKIATCLKAENKSLTKAQVEKVLGDFAPPAPRG
ncbi:hypothetical protein ACEN2J_11635 [Pseudorhodobacter sp. W20_MBD10_FR17]|uniref:hypothetical protein n=1 Tax=Pseudorhodobacter sp. W20_MBD10_FR17 TaxID=3240266 RepID=UPI003F97BDFC